MHNLYAELDKKDEQGRNERIYFIATTIFFFSRHHISTYSRHGSRFDIVHLEASKAS